MSSRFPEYDPTADHGMSEAPEDLGADAVQRLSYPSLDAMAAADPYEVAAVLLRGTFRFPSGRAREEDVVGRDLEQAIERSLRNHSRGLVSSLTNRQPAAFRRVQARTLAIWRTAGVADTLPGRLNAEQELVLIEPDLLVESDATLGARLRRGPDGRQPRPQ